MAAKRKATAPIVQKARELTARLVEVVRDTDPAVEARHQAQEAEREARARAALDEFHAKKKR